MGYPSFFRAVLRWWWALTSSAILTFIGIYALVANKSTAWVIAADLIAADLLFYVAVYGAWKEERKCRLNAEQRAVAKPRPKIVPVRWGKKLGEAGLIVRNDGEPAFSISIDEPIAIGDAILDFRERVYPGLTQPQGELLIEACIRLGHGSLTGGGALRDLMIEAKLDSIPLMLHYRDFDGQEYTTPCEVVKEFWDEGLRIRPR